MIDSICTFTKKKMMKKKKCQEPQFQTKKHFLATFHTQSYRNFHYKALLSHYKKDIYTRDTKT